MPTEYMVQMLDPDGLPRAWAVSEELDTAKEHAEYQLNIYVESKLSSCGPKFKEEQFTYMVTKFTEAEGEG